MSKLDSIDIVKLYAMGSNNGWNEFLTDCHRKHDIGRLARTLRALQVGMADAVKKKAVTEEIEIQWVRWIKSIENTARGIIRERHPLPQDNPLIAKNHGGTLEIKRRRRQELQAFLKKESY